MLPVANVLTTQSQIRKSGLVYNLDPTLYISYPGSGTVARDLSSNHYTSTLERGVGYDNTTQRVPCFTFNGATDYQYIETGDTFDLPEYSLCAWVKSPLYVDTDKVIISKENDIGTEALFKLYVGFANIVTLQIISPTQTKTFFGGTVDPDNWNFVVATVNFTTDKVSIYHDAGTWVNNQTMNFTGAISSGTNCWIGLSAKNTGNPDGDSPYDGYIGQCLIYNRVITAQEVRSLYQIQRTKYRYFD